MRKPSHSPENVEYGTGIGQLRRVPKRRIATEQQAFARLRKRRVALKGYIWRPEHTDASWAWRRIE